MCAPCTKHVETAVAAGYVMVGAPRAFRLECDRCTYTVTTVSDPRPGRTPAQSLMHGDAISFTHLKRHYQEAHP